MERAARPSHDCARFDLDQDVAILPVAAVEQLMRNAGFAPDHFSRLLPGFAHAPVVEGHLVLAFGQRHDQIRQQMLVPRLALAGFERQAPHPHEFVLEHDLVADRSQCARGCGVRGHDRSPIRCCKLAGARPLFDTGLARIRSPIGVIAAMWSSGRTRTRVSRGQPMQLMKPAADVEQRTFAQAAVERRVPVRHHQVFQARECPGECRDGVARR